MKSTSPKAVPSIAGVADTPTWRVDPHRLQADKLRDAGKLLSQGCVIVYPTETFYGLGGNPNLLIAIERIYRIKGREFSKPLPLIAANPEAVYHAVAEWPFLAGRLAQAFWPGPLTLILRAASRILPEVHGYTGKIGVRISSHPVAHALATEAGGLLIATSANQSHQRPYRSASEMPKEFLALVDGIIDAGSCGGNCGNLPSTIVDASAFPLRLIRQGCIPWERLQEVMG